VSNAVVIRPLRRSDAERAYRIAEREFDLPSGPDEAERHKQDARWHGRINHLIDTDPGGAWAAEHGGRLVGVAIALVREGVWALSLFAVAAHQQGRGVGHKLLERALAHGEGTHCGLVISSGDPRAMRSYARAGFALRPTVCASGSVDRGALAAPDPHIREGDRGDLEWTAQISRAVRGASHALDLTESLRHGGRLLGMGDRGFVVHDRGRVQLLAARDEQAAQALLWAALAEGDGGVPAEVRWITAGQDWAVDVALRARLELKLAGALFVHGEPGPLRPYLPSGVYL
jgi:GNAT superfamily N-acetyltransferase